MIRVVHSGSRIQGSKRHQIPDPQHWGGKMNFSWEWTRISFLIFYLPYCWSAILMPTTSFKHVGKSWYFKLFIAVLSVCLYFLISAIFQHYRRCVPRRSPRLRYLQRRNSRYTAKKIPNPPRALSLRHPRRCGACRVFHNLHTTALSVCFSLSLSYRIQTLGPNLENSFSSLVMLL